MCAVTPEFCLGKAEECELIAAEAGDERAMRQWLVMAVDWRIAASGPLTPPHKKGGGLGSPAVNLN